MFLRMAGKSLHCSKYVRKEYRTAYPNESMTAEHTAVPTKPSAQLIEKGENQMKTLLKNGSIVNVFTDTVEKASVLIEDDHIIGLGDYSEDDADLTEDVSGKLICPGLIDGHIHIESTMLSPAEFFPCLSAAWHNHGHRRSA